MPPLRVLHAIDSAGIYGAEIMLLNLAQEQQRAGLFPIILSIGNPQHDIKPLEIEARNRGLPCISLRIKDGLNLRGARAVIELARGKQIDVIHSHGYKCNILLALLPKSRRNIPVITTLHGWTAKTVFSKLGIYRLLDQWLLPRLDAVAAVSPTMLTMRALRRLAKPAYLIANGIADSTATEPDDALTKHLRELDAANNIVIGAIGRLSAEKNFAALIDAYHTICAAHSNVKLLILGDGPEMSALAARCTNLGLNSNSILRGYTANAQRYLVLFDLFVLPSLTEGLPMVILEALAASTPIIATAVGAVPTAIEEIGTTVPPGDTAALTAALEFFLEHRDSETIRAQRGPIRVAERYSASAMAAAYTTLYRSL